MKIETLYEDAHFLVINKPAGLVVHADGKTDEPNLVDWLVAKFPTIKEVGEHIELANGKTIFKSGIVHRIDRDTSGVLLVAKDPEAYLFAKEQFQNRGIRKSYAVFVYGTMKDDRGKIDRPIGRSKNDFRKWTAQRGTRGEMRDAVTEYTVLKRGRDMEGANISDTISSGTRTLGAPVTYLEARPLTGRTHQIRVHFKAINHPVVSDSLYAERQPQLLGLTRLGLHARQIEFTTMEGKRVKIEAPLPTDFAEALKLLEKSENLA